MKEDNTNIPFVDSTERTNLEKEFNRIIDEKPIQYHNSSISNNIPILKEIIKMKQNEDVSTIKENIRLFFTGFLQVFFVAINTYFITQQLFIGVFIVSFLISFIWSFNVRKVVFGNLKDRIIYSLGASIGGLSGLLLATQYSKISYLLSLI